MPDDLDVRVGSLVRVPLRGRRVRGWVIDIRDDPYLPARIRDKLRSIRELVTAMPVANNETLALAQWAADHYIGALSTILGWATPTPLPRCSREVRKQRVLMPARHIPYVTEAICTGRPIEAFIRTWPGDDGAGTIAALATALPPDRTALVVSPTGRRPALPDGISVVDVTHPQARAHTLAWEHAVSGTARLVCSGRRGPLIPIPNLGLVIVTQEHSPWHKDERTPALDARVLARRRAASAGVPFVAIAPTSPIGHEGVLAAAKAAQTQVTELTVPGASDRWPTIEVTDLSIEGGTSGPLGERFFPAVRRALKSGGRTLVFLNRKGTARSLVCRACGNLAECPKCAGLLRPSENCLRCSRCEESLPFVACPACGSDSVALRGIGVTKLCSELAASFPGVEVTEAAGTNAPTPIPGGIVVGTQVALRYQRLFDLVVLIDPDAMLGRSGLRAEEASFQILVDAVGTAKGRPNGGRVLIQTRRPDHPAIRALVSADCSSYERLCISEREVVGLPPWRRLLQVRCTDADFIDELATVLANLDCEVLGPRPDPKPSLIAVVEIDRWESIAAAVRELRGQHPDIRVRVEADPLDP